MTVGTTALPDYGVGEGDANEHTQAPDFSCPTVAKAGSDKEVLLRVGELMA